MIDVTHTPGRGYREKIAQGSSGGIVSMRGVLLDVGGTLLAANEADDCLELRVIEAGHAS